MLDRRMLARVGVVAAGFLVLTGGAVGVLVGTGALQRPVVEDVRNQWGAVGEEDATVETAVTVRNPNGVSLPGVVGVAYDIRMNDVVVASGSRGGVGLAPGENRIALTTRLPHDRIAAWWVTHVNRGEESTVRVEPSVSLPGVTRDLPARERSIETDLLGRLSDAGARTVELRGEPLLAVANQTARWGEATAETTPLTFGARVTNEHDRPVTFDAFRYEITMNDVTVGAGRAGGALALRPGEAATLDLDAAIDTPKMADWWETHLENGEASRVTVRLAGVTTDGEGDTAAVPVLNRTLSFETDLLGSGSASVELVRAGANPAVPGPTVDVAETTWAEGTGTGAGATTRSVTDLTVDGVGDSPLLSVATAELAAETRVNGVPFGSGSTTAGAAALRNGSVTLATTYDASAVPEWWAAHVNAGEHSTVVTETTAVLDAGFTALSLDLADRRRTVDTAVLDGFNSTADQAIEVEGRHAGTITGTTATWGTATADRAPVTVTASLRNEGPVPLTVERVEYRVTAGGVLLADDAATPGTTVAPGDTDCVCFTMALDSDRMADWWPVHVANGEQSTLHVEATAVVSVHGETKRVPLSALTGDTPIRTTLLDDGGEADGTDGGDGGTDDEADGKDDEADGTDGGGGGDSGGN